MKGGALEVLPGAFQVRLEPPLRYNMDQLSSDFECAFDPNDNCGTFMDLASEDLSALIARVGDPVRGVFRHSGNFARETLGISEKQGRAVKWWRGP